MTLWPGRLPWVVVPTVITRPEPRIRQVNKSVALPVMSLVNNATGFVYCQSPQGEI